MPCVRLDTSLKTQATSTTCPSRQTLPSIFDYSHKSPLILFSPNFSNKYLARASPFYEMMFEFADGLESSVKSSSLRAAARAWSCATCSI